MANIGTFTALNDSYTGTVRTLTRRRRQKTGHHRRRRLRKDESSERFHAGLLPNRK